MDNSILEHVKVEHLDALVDALADVVADMRSIEADHRERYQDDAYATCLMLESMVLGFLGRSFANIKLGNIAR